MFVIHVTKQKITLPCDGLSIIVEDKWTALHAQKINTFIDKNLISVSYFSYCTFPQAGISNNSKKIVEIHDVLHLREQEFKKYGFKAPYSMNDETEFSLLRAYDALLAINIDEVSYLRERGLKKAFFVPPHFQYTPVDSVSESGIGFIGSNATPNIYSLKLLLESSAKLDNLHIAGPISAVVDEWELQRDKPHLLGILKSPAEFYKRINIALSPIVFGAGLKIKVLEAISFGKPIVATSHSITGFPAGIEDVTTVEDDFNAWNNRLFERTISINTALIRSYHEENFGFDVAYACLYNVLHEIDVV